MTEKMFAKGIFARKPHEKAPDFVKCDLSFKLPDAVEWLEEHPNNEGFVRVTVKESKNGKWYCELDGYVPTPRKDDINPEDIPF